MDSGNLPSVADVRAIYTTTAVDATITAAIGDASIMLDTVDGLLSSSGAIQKSTCKYVAAHLLSTMGSGALVSKRIGDASESYQQSSLAFGEGMKSTTYGQRAILFCPALGNIGKPRPSFQVL